MKTIMEKYLYILPLVMMLGMAPSQKLIQAHGLGQSLTKTVGDYTIEVEYEALKLQADESVRLDFSITKKDTKEEVQFTDIWVRIAQGNKTVFAGALAKANFGKPGMTYTFPEAGEYELSVRFQNADKTVAEAPFQLRVERATAGKTKQKKLPSQLIVGAIIGLVIGFSLSFLTKRQKVTSP